MSLMTYASHAGSEIPRADEMTYAAHASHVSHVSHASHEMTFASHASHAPHAFHAPHVSQQFCSMDLLHSALRA